MQSDVRVALIGVGGYGNTHLRALLDRGPAHGARLVAAIDPHPPEASAAELSAAGIPLVATLSDFYSAGHTADLVVIAAPIHLHAPFSCLALEHGAHVLCEKPLAGSLADAHRIIRTAEKTRRIAAIAYQWSYSDAIQTLKSDILCGTLGRPRRMRTLCIWPRPRSYYQRNTWAGRLTSADGAAVLDSPVNNATAHYLHNMLYLAGPARTQTATPRRITAELYRANPIQSYDTAAVRILLDDNVELFFYTTHAASPLTGPVFELEFERATVTYTAGEDPRVRARFADGTHRDYGDPNATAPNVLWQTIEAVRTGGPVACDAAAALAHTRCVSAAMQSSPIHTLPAGSTRIDPHPNGDSLTWMPGLADVLLSSYRAWRLPSECPDVQWAIPGKPIDIPTEPVS